MDGHAAIGDDRTLRRIVMVLVSLAAMAEAVAARSLPVRLLVLCILRHAEVVAREFVSRTTPIPQPAVVEVPPIQNGPADAVLLAARFKALAAAFVALLRPDRPCRNVRIGGALRRFAPGHGPRLITLGGGGPRPLDTS